jgi:hypothetical protein
VVDRIALISLPLRNPFFGARLRLRSERRAQATVITDDESRVMSLTSQYHDGTLDR